jgi:hypothetical protein
MVVMDTRYVFFEVRTEFLNIIYKNSMLQSLYCNLAIMMK